MLLLLSLLVFVYQGWLSPAARKSTYVFENYQKIRPGMARVQAEQLLTPPDNVYNWNDSTICLSYYMGFGAPDDVRVLIVEDTVVAVSYNQ